MINGIMLREAILSGAANIANHRREVDELNVYPVPDGDTGTNMSMTMSNARKELHQLEGKPAASQVADAAASALLRGARGNSGVILSLLFRGFSKGLSGRKTIDGSDLVRALELGVQAAYKAVMKPTEGTILTVARVAMETARARIQNEPRLVEEPASLWELVCNTAEETLQITPDMLPILKKAGVVDAGGKGLVLIWTAMLQVFQGKQAVQYNSSGFGATSEQPPVSTAERHISRTSIVGRVDEEITFTYCTEYLVRRAEDSNDPMKLRAQLETIGDCVVVVDDDDVIKVHVHTEHPGNALEAGLKFGSLINMKIENMREQHESKVREAQLSEAGREDFIPVEPEKPYGFVTIASGDGIEAMFRDLGADIVVRGGQTMNPSTDDILRAIQSTPAETVFVLPNNKNIILAAEQAVHLADRRVCVLQSRSIPQGIAALLAFDGETSFNQNRLSMTKALERVQTGLITYAARDAEHEGVQKGEILALENGRLAFSGKDVNPTAYRLIKRLIKADSGFITVLYGADVTTEQADTFAQLLHAKLGDRMEITMIRGGQPVYYYIISVE